MSAVRAKVNRFVDELSAVLVGLGSAAGVSPVPPERLRHDCAIEAFGIACGVLGGDGRHSDDELWELAAGFGTHLDGQIGGATPAEIRTSGVVERFADRLNNPLRRRKLSPVDRHARNLYQAYTEARERMLAETHTPQAPWTLVDFNDQRLGRLTLLRDLLDRLPDTKLPLENIPWPPLDHEPIEERFGVLKPIKPYRWRDKGD